MSNHNRIQSELKKKLMKEVGEEKKNTKINQYNTHKRTPIYHIPQSKVHFANNSIMFLLCLFVFLIFFLFEIEMYFITFNCLPHQNFSFLFRSRKLVRTKPKSRRRRRNWKNQTELRII